MLCKPLNLICVGLLLPLAAGAQNKPPQPAKKVQHPVRIEGNSVEELTGKTSLAAGKTQTIAYFDGAAEVTSFRLKIEPADRYTLRQTLLHIYWDDADKPAVEVPVGDFFGIPFEPVEFKALYLLGDKAGNVSQFPMRFRRRMRVELANRGKTSLGSVQWKIAFKRLGKTVAPPVYFHACWARIETKPEQPAIVWQSIGRTEVLGTALALQSVNGEFAPIASEKSQIRFWSGGGAEPAISATLPRFFDLNPLPRNAVTYARTGTTTMAQTIGRMTAYGFLDMATFQAAQDARLDVSFPEKVNTAATTYWLQSLPTHDIVPISDDQLKPAVFHLRNVIEAESLKWEEGSATKASDQGFKTEASGGEIMTIKPGTTSASFPVTVEDVYVLNLAALLRASGAQKYRYALDNEPFSELAEASIDPLTASETSLWITSVPLHLKSGNHKLALQIPGDKPLSLDYLELMPSRKVDGAVEVENLVDQVKVSPGTKLSRNDENPEYSGSSFLQWENVPENAELALPVECPKEGDYRLDLGIWRDVGSMKLTVKLDGKEIGEVDAFVSNADTAVLPLIVGKLQDISAGRHTLTLTAQAPKVGKMGKLNFDYYKLTRLAE